MDVSTKASGKLTAKARLEVAIEALHRAMLAADRAVLGSLTADALSYGHSAGKVEDKAAFVEAVVNGPARFAAISVDSQSIEIVSGIGIVRHISMIETLAPAGRGHMRASILQVWQRHGDAWKLLARQAVKLG